MFCRSCFALLLLLLSACSPPLRGEPVEGLLLEHESQFVSTDGRVYPISTAQPQHAQLNGIVGPRCLRIDASLAEEPADPWGYDDLVVHRVLSDSAPERCHFETQTYRGLLLRPVEGIYFFTAPEASSDWSKPWAVVHVNGDWTFASYYPPEFGGNPPRRMCMEVEATASQVGRFNHLGRSERQLTVARVVRMWLPPALADDFQARRVRQGPLAVVAEEIESCLSS